MRRIHKVLEMAPDGLVRGAKGLLYSTIPYRLSQSLERVARPEAVAGARRLAQSARKFRAIFIHIPKVAGVSVRRSLFGEEHFEGHHPIRNYMMMLEEGEFRSFYKFCFVRNPWDRVYSAYSFLARGGMNEQDRAWAARELTGVPDFRTFVLDRLAEPSIQRSLHFLPQLNWITDPGGRIMVDTVGRYERIAEDFETVRNRLGVSGSLIWDNKTSGKTGGYREVFDDRMAGVVADVYAEDIERFDYTF